MHEAWHNLGQPEQICTIHFCLPCKCHLFFYDWSMNYLEKPVCKHLQYFQGGTGSLFSSAEFVNDLNPLRKNEKPSVWMCVFWVSVCICLIKWVCLNQTLQLDRSFLEAVSESEGKWSSDRGLSLCIHLPPAHTKTSQTLLHTDRANHWVHPKVMASGFFTVIQWKTNEPLHFCCEMLHKES